MKHSIEHIWQQGFFTETSTAIPKINDLYNKKSQNVVDKIHRMYVLNVRYLFGAAFAAVIFLLVFKWFVLAAVMPCLLLWLAFTGKTQLKRLEQNSKADSSYQYIKNFHLWFHQMIVDFTSVYNVFYPVFALAVLLEIRLSTLGEHLTQMYQTSFSDNLSVFGTPLIFYAVAIIIIGVMRYFAKTFFLFDLKLMYGRVMKKLDEILSDMEELRR